MSTAAEDPYGAPHLAVVPPLPAEVMEPTDGPDVEAEVAALEAAAPEGLSLVEALHTVIEAEPERWRITDDNGAEYAGRKMKAAQEALTVLHEQRAAWVAQIDRWLDAAVREPSRTVAFFDAHLRDYALRQRADKRLSFRLPSVDVKTRGSDEPTIEMTDADAVLAWAKRNAPGIVKTTEKVNVTDVRTVTRIAYVDGAPVGVIDEGTGEPVPGCAVAFPDVTVTIKTV